VVSTRRALLGAGAASLLVAGCGPPDEPEVNAAEVWNEQLRASQAALAAYEGVEDAARLRPRAASRVDRLEALAGAAGATPAVTPGLEAALEAERAALRTHVAGVGLLEDRPSRELLAGLIAETAQAESELLVLLDRRPIETAFPGQPVPR